MRCSFAKMINCVNTDNKRGLKREVKRISWDEPGIKIFPDLVKIMTSDI